MRPLPPTREQRRGQIAALALERGIDLGDVDEPLRTQLMMAAGRELVRREMRDAGLMIGRDW